MMVRLQDASLVLRASWAAQSIITAVCADADDKDAVLDALLKPRYGWPQYVRVDGEDKDKGKAAVEGTSGQPETLSELAYVLGLQLGFNAILYESDGQNRHACMLAPQKCLLPSLQQPALEACWASIHCNVLISRENHLLDVAEV